MAGYPMLPVVFHVVLVFVDCLKVNPRPGELLVTCPLNGDYKTQGFAISGSEKGDNKDTSTVFGCTWPQGSQGKENCFSYDNVSLVQLRERRVDLSVPTAFFNSNRTFTCDHPDSFPCAVFEPDEAHVTPSTPSPSSADNDAVMYLAIFFAILFALLVLAVFYIIHMQRRNNKWKDLFQRNRSERANLLGDVEMARPQHVFMKSPRSDNKSLPSINCILFLPGGRLMMIDDKNNNVKVMEVASPRDVTTLLTVDEQPCCLALLPDVLVAMTTNQPLIYLLTVMDRVTVKAKIQTDKQYRGIAGLRRDHLIVSYGKFSSGPATVDILTMEGSLVKTVTDSIRLPELRCPHYLCLTGDGHVMVSDWAAHKVFQVNINSGQATLTHEHADMKWPHQLCVDSASQLYVASEGGQCVLKRDKAGKWEPILKTHHYSDLGFDSPRGLCVTSCGLLVVAWRNELCSSIIVAYRL